MYDFCSIEDRYGRRRRDCARKVWAFWHEIVLEGRFIKRKTMD